jgi:hypothetical protein
MAQDYTKEVRAPDGKLTKASVDYSYGKPHAHCGLCIHFAAPSTCSIVSGPVQPKMWCRKFKHRGG